MRTIIALTLLCCLLFGFAAAGCQSRPPQQLGETPTAAPETAKTDEGSPTPDSPLGTLTPLKIGTPEPTPSAAPTGNATETTNTGGDQKVGKLIAVITTDKGVIKAELRPDVAPNTELNFVTLAKKGFYDNLNFHRVEPGFVIQGGDPKGDGTGGPGYCIPSESNNEKHVL